MRDSELVALPEDRAAQIAGVSKRQLGYWARTALVAPSLDRQLVARNPVRLYSFQDMVELLVVAELRSRGKSLQQIRRLLERLRRRGYKKPLREIKFATGDKPDEIYFQHPDGSWEGDIRPDQVVIAEVLNLEHIRQRVERAVHRDPKEAGKVDRRRGRMGAKPVFAGTRVPVATVVSYLRHGYSTRQILTAFPNLTEADVETARRELISA
jgi:uncharacterized protein (DUF433 family)